MGHPRMLQAATDGIMILRCKEALARRLLRERGSGRRTPVRRMVIVLTLVSVLAAMLVLVGPATAQISDAPSLPNRTVLHARMTGEQVVPGPGDPAGFGGLLSA